MNSSTQPYQPLTYTEHETKVFSVIDKMIAANYTYVSIWDWIGLYVYYELGANLSARERYDLDKSFQLYLREKYANYGVNQK